MSVFLEERHECHKKRNKYIHEECVAICTTQYMSFFTRDLPKYCNMIRGFEIHIR